MKRVLARVVSVVAVLAVAATGAVSSAASAPLDDAAAVRHLHDTLVATAAAGDIAGTESALAGLDTVLARVSAGNKDLASPARDEAVAARYQLAEQFPDGARTRGVPTVPEALNMLLQKLLATLSELSDNLLGGGVPIPV